MNYRSGSYRTVIRPDPWNKQNYLAADRSQIYSGPGVIRDVLETAGYRVVDADQFGETYRHPAYPLQEIEVDELSDPEGANELKFYRRGISVNELTEQLKEIKDTVEDFLHELDSKRHLPSYR